VEGAETEAVQVEQLLKNGKAFRRQGSGIIVTPASETHV
jgi:hypothetical protein